MCFQDLINKRNDIGYDGYWHMDTRHDWYKRSESQTVAELIVFIQCLVFTLVWQRQNKMYAQNQYTLRPNLSQQNKRLKLGTTMKWHVSCRQIIFSFPCKLSELYAARVRRGERFTSRRPVALTYLSPTAKLGLLWSVWLWNYQCVLAYCVIHPFWT